MGALLEDRIAAWVGDHPGVTLHEILRAVPCLQKTAEEILANPLFVEWDGRWRLGEAHEPTGGACVSPSGLVDGPPGRDDGTNRAAHQQLALTGTEFRRPAVA